MKKLRALANKKRLAIVRTLLDGESNVGSLLRKHKGSQPSMSQALTVLRKSGLIARRQAGQQKIYSVVNPPAVKHALEALNKL